MGVEAAEGGGRCVGVEELRSEGRRSRLGWTWAAGEGVRTQL